MDEQIQNSTILQWINTTLKFLRNDNQVIIEYPEMPVKHMKYLHNLIWQQNNVGLCNKSIYSSLWEAMKIFSMKYSFKVFFKTSEDGNTGKLVIEKILKEYQENNRPTDENINNSKQQKKIGPKPSNSPTLSPSKTQKHTPKQDKFFTDCRKIIDSISPAILRKGLQKLLNFLYNKMDASVIFSDLAPIEARFYENFLGIYNRRCEFQGLLSPACNDLLEKMCEFFKEFDKECKIEVYPSKHNMDFRKREVTFMKVPRYTKNSSKTITSPVLKTTCNTQKANNTDSVSVPALNNVSSCISNVSANSNVINKKLSMSSSIHNQLSMSTAINLLSASSNNSSTKNVSSSPSNKFLLPNPIKTTNNCANPASSTIDKTLSPSSAITNLPSTSTGNSNMLPLFSVTNDTLSKSNAFNKAIPASSAIKNISLSNATNKEQLISNIMSGSNAKNKPFSLSPIRTESMSNRDKVQSPSHLSVKHVPPSPMKTHSISSVGKNIVTASSTKKEVSRSCAINNVPSPSKVIDNKPKSNPSRKEKLMEAMSTPLESEKGLRIMRSMGWEGGALGLRGEGLIEPIIPALHIVPGVGLGHEAPIKKSQVKTTKAKTKVDNIVNKSTKVNNRLNLLAIILELLHRETMYSATYPISLAKKEILTFDNIINSLNMRSSNCLTSVENVSLEKIEKIMAQNLQLSLRMEFSSDMSELTIVKSSDDNIEVRCLKKPKKKKTIHKTYINETSEMLLKDELAMHVCADILNFIRREETRMVIALDEVLVDKYKELLSTVSECINRKVLIPYAPLRHLAIDILKVSQDSCVELQLGIKKKSFVLHKICYPIIGSQNKKTKHKHGAAIDKNNSINMLEQKEAALTSSSYCQEYSKKECQVPTTSAMTCSKIRAIDENKPSTGNNNKICKHIDSNGDNIKKPNNSNAVPVKTTHENVDNIELDKIKTDEINEITNDQGVKMIKDKDNESNEHLESAKNATNASLSVLEENKEQIQFTQNIYEQIDSLLEKLENYEKTRNTQPKSLHKYVDNINNNKSVDAPCARNEIDLSFNETDISCKEKNKQDSGMKEDKTDVDEASSNKINVSKKQADEQDMNTNNLCEEVDPSINNLDKSINETTIHNNSKTEVLERNENDNSNNTETVSYIFLVDTLHSYINGDNQSSIYSREDISTVTPLLIQDNSLIGNFEELGEDSRNSNMSKDKETNELNSLKPVSCNTANIGGQFYSDKFDNFICTKENRKFRKRKAVISVETDNFKNINENLLKNAIEALTSHSKVIDNIDEIAEVHKKIIKGNYYDKNKDSIKVKDRLKFAKSTKISEKIDKLSEMASYTSRKWYRHYENFLKCDEFVGEINAHNPDNIEDLVTYIDNNDTLIEKGLKPINTDLNINTTEEIRNSIFKCNDKTRSTISNVAINEPAHNIVIEEKSVKLNNLKIEAEYSKTVIENVYMEVEKFINKAGIENKLVIEPKPFRHLMNETEAIKVLEKVDEVSLEMDTKEFQHLIELTGSEEILTQQQENKSKLNIEVDKDDEAIKHVSEDVSKISNALRNLNSTEIIKCYDIVIIESDEYTTEELKNTVQKLIRNNVALDDDILPLLKYHGTFDDGIVYSCHSKETCLWLKRVLRDFKVKDYKKTIDTHRMKIRVTNFNENVNLFELLELYYAGINSRDWTVIFEKQLDGVLIFGVEMNTDSFRIVFDNNFSLFAGFDVAQFSIGY